MKVYIYKLDEGIDCISSIYTAQTPTEAELEDSAFYFDKIKGYTATYDEQGVLKLKFDEEKYNKLVAEEKAKEEAEKAEQEKEEAQKDILDMVSVSYEDSDKEGYKYKVYKLGDLTIKKEYVQIESETATENDGSDYIKPITYTTGMTVTKGLWYTDGSDVWECIKDGTPTSFSDTEYFNIVSA